MIIDYLAEDREYSDLRLLSHEEFQITFIRDDGKYIYHTVNGNLGAGWAIRHARGVGQQDNCVGWIVFADKRNQFIELARWLDSEQEWVDDCNHCALPIPLTPYCILTMWGTWYCSHTCLEAIHDIGM